VKSKIFLFYRRSLENGYLRFNNQNTINMKKKHFCCTSQSSILSVLIIFMFFTSAVILKAQTQPDFSGKWIFDKTQSSAGLVESGYEGAVVRKIIQNPTTITFSDVYLHPDRDEWETATDSYNLDGQEQIIKRSIGTTKKTAAWSEDKKILTLTNFDSQTHGGVTNEYLVKDSYSLSENGLVLTVERYSKNPVAGDTTAKKVYNKQ
jgi:hypothetical protein